MAEVLARSLNEEISPAMVQLGETRVTACHEISRFVRIAHALEADMEHEMKIS